MSDETKATTTTQDIVFPCRELFRIANGVLTEEEHKALKLKRKRDEEELQSTVYWAKYLISLHKAFDWLDPLYFPAEDYSCEILEECVRLDWRARKAGAPRMWPTKFVLVPCEEGDGHYRNIREYFDKGQPRCKFVLYLPNRGFLVGVEQEEITERFGRVAIKWSLMYKISDVLKKNILGRVKILAHLLKLNAEEREKDKDMKTPFLTAADLGELRKCFLEAVLDRHALVPNHLYVTFLATFASVAHAIDFVRADCRDDKITQDMLRSYLSEFTQGWKFSFLTDKNKQIHDALVRYLSE